jgi:hypothetical protein
MADTSYPHIGAMVSDSLIYWGTLRMHPFVFLTGGTQRLREAYAAVMLKQTFLWGFNNPRSDYAYYGDAYTEMLDLQGPYKADVAREFAAFRYLAFTEVQNVTQADVPMLRSVLTRRQGKTTFMTTPSMDKLAHFGDSVLELLADNFVIDLDS